eukprot:8908729-Alexandrium_andersonii.AAC.1
MSASLVGSEMCIRDSCATPNRTFHPHRSRAGRWRAPTGVHCPARGRRGPVSYTHLTLPTICSV